MSYNTWIKLPTCADCCSLRTSSSNYCVAPYAYRVICKHSRDSECPGRGVEAENGMATYAEMTKQAPESSRSSRNIARPKRIYQFATEEKQGKRLVIAIFSCLPAA